MYKNVSWSTLCNNGKLETTYMTINKEMANKTWDTIYSEMNWLKWLTRVKHKNKLQNTWSMMPLSIGWKHAKSTYFVYKYIDI